MKEKSEEFRILLIIAVSILALGLTIYFIIPSLTTFLHDYYWNNGLHMGRQAFLSKLLVYNLSFLALLIVFIVAILIPNNKETTILAIGISGGIMAFYLFALNMGNKSWIYSLSAATITATGIYLYKSYEFTKAFALSLTAIIIVFTSWFTLPTPYHPIHQAVYKQDIQNVEKMLRKDPSLANQPSQRTGLPPLFNAGKDMTNLLLKYGANVHATGAYYGESLLTFKPCSLKVVKLIIEGGFNVRETSYTGKNALLIQKDPEVIELLLKAGVDPNQ